MSFSHPILPPCTFTSDGHILIYMRHADEFALIARGFRFTASISAFELWVQSNYLCVSLMLFVAVLHCTAMDTLFIPPGFSWDYSPSTMRNDSIMIVVVAVNKRSGIVIGLLIYSPPEICAIGEIYYHRCPLLLQFSVIQKSISLGRAAFNCGTIKVNLVSRRK